MIDLAEKSQNKIKKFQKKYKTTTKEYQWNFTQYNLSNGDICGDYSYNVVVLAL